jgi:hypothetical protein
MASVSAPTLTFGPNSGSNQTSREFAATRKVAASAVERHLVTVSMDLDPEEVDGSSPFGVAILHNKG